MKHGFMLIELIVVTLISSMVAGVLLTALTQSGRFQRVIDNVVDTSLRVGIVSNQLEKDLMGAFVPVQAEQQEQEEQESPEDAEEAPADNKKNETQKPGEKKVDDKKVQKKKKQPPLEKIFYGTHKEGNLDTLTFITNNPLTVYIGKDIGVVKPKIVRVQYTLKPEDGKQNSFALYRQESMELDLAQYKNTRSYEVISGIKSFSVVYTARIEKKQEAPKTGEGQAQPQEQKKIIYEYKTSKDWVSERKTEGDKEQEFPRMPHTVEIKMTLWDRQDQQDKEFTLVSEIPINSVPIKKPAPPKKPEPAKQPETSNSAKASSGKPANSAKPSQPALSARVNIGHTGLQSDQRTARNDRGGKPDAPVDNALESLTKTLKNLTKMLG